MLLYKPENLIWRNESYALSKAIKAIPLPPEVAVQNVNVNSTRISPMSDPNESKNAVIRQKENLAAESLKVANEAIGLLQDQMSECSTRDLVQIFTAAVKAHREITDDIVVLTAKESPSEESLGREYDGKVEELLKRISNF